MDQIDRLDQDWFGLPLATKAYATEMQPNGKQLRVYHADGTVCISYNAF